MAYTHYGSHSTEWGGGVEAQPMTIRATSSVFLPIAGAVASMAGMLTVATRTLKCAWFAWSDPYPTMAAPASAPPASSGSHRPTDHAQLRISSVRASAMRQVVGRIFARFQTKALRP